MSFFKDFIDNLFGIKNNNRDHSNQGNDHEHFRNPIWQNDQGEDDDDNTDDYRSNHFSHSGPGIHFEVFTNPIEITRFFESEMENLMKSLSSSFGLDIPAIENIPSAYENTQSSGIGKKNLRDEVLKPEFSRNYDFNRPKIDEDLDGKINAGELSTAWKNSKDLESREVFPHTFSIGQSTVYKFTKHHDGTVEETKITTDSSGNTEQIIKRKTGDNKIHTVITKKDNKGFETETFETSTFENMIESKIDPIERVESILSSFPWHKFFGDIPKI